MAESLPQHGFLPEVLSLSGSLYPFPLTSAVLQILHNHLLLYYSFWCLNVRDLFGTGVRYAFSEMIKVRHVRELSNELKGRKLYKVPDLK